MQNENEVNNKMENVFYAALALHVAGKPINKENIKTVMKAAGTPVDEPVLEMVAAFMESLKLTGSQNEGNDPRVIKILTGALTQQKLQVEQLQALLNELSQTASARTKTGQLVSGPRVNGLNEKPATGLVRTFMDGNPTPGPTAVERSTLRGRYVYGITASAKDLTLGPIGIDGNEVYTIITNDMGAIVHDCAAEPYQSLDDEKVKRWVKAHQNVLDMAREHFSIIIPLGFDTIIKPGDDSASPDQVVRDWLKSENQRFRSVISRIEGKDEYAVQISYVPSEINKHLPAPSEEVTRIKAAMVGKSPGVAYIYQQKLEKALKVDMEKMADRWFADFFARIRNKVDDIIVEKNRRVDDSLVMLLNLSCLVAKEKVLGLGVELESIDKLEGFSVHFSGPWPPYSFVAQLPVDGEKGIAMQPTRDAQTTLVDLLDRILDKGLIVDADIIIHVAGIPLIGIKLKAAIAGIETMLKYGIWEDWEAAQRAVSTQESRLKQKKEMKVG